MNMSEWNNQQVGTFMELVNGFAFKSADFVTSGIPIIKIKNVKPNKINLESLDYVSEEVALGKERVFIKPDDILITMSGNRIDGSRDTWVGKVSIFGLQGRYLLNQRVGALRRRANNIDNKYLAYCLSADSYQEHFINQANSSGGQANISPEIILSTEIPVPPIEEQRAIAEVLSSLDDKIDLLHRQNKTLESLAETLFRHWFIDQDTDNIGRLDDILELHYGKTLKEDERSGEGFPVVGSSGIIGYHTEALVKGPGIVIGRKGTLGKITYLFGDFFPIDTTYFVKPKLTDGLFYEYFLLKSLDFAEMNSDSAVPGLNREIALATEVFLPKDSRRVEFNNCCVDLFSKIMQNTRQITSLSITREMLLPKLMNGQVRTTKD